MDQAIWKVFHWMRKIFVTWGYLQPVSFWEIFSISESFFKLLKNCSTWIQSGSFDIFLAEPGLEFVWWKLMKDISHSRRRIRNHFNFLWVIKLQMDFIFILSSFHEKICALSLQPELCKDWSLSISDILTLQCTSVSSCWLSFSCGSENVQQLKDNFFCQ